MQEDKPTLSGALGELAGVIISIMLAWSFQAGIIHVFWNASLSGLFQLPTISYGQAFSISAICSTLLRPSTHAGSKSSSQGHE